MAPRLPPNAARASSRRNTASFGSVTPRATRVSIRTSSISCFDRPRRLSSLNAPLIRMKPACVSASAVPFLIASMPPLLTADMPQVKTRATSYLFFSASDKNSTSAAASRMVSIPSGVSLLSSWVPKIRDACHGVRLSSILAISTEAFSAETGLLLLRRRSSERYSRAFCSLPRASTTSSKSLDLISSRAWSISSKDRSIICSGASRIGVTRSTAPSSGLSRSVFWGAAGVAAVSLTINSACPARSVTQTTSSRLTRLTRTCCFFAALSAAISSTSAFMLSKWERTLSASVTYPSLS